ncbi:MAG: tRNA pseudouridine(38-40) synthase TruA [Oscillospiraceae bacterium]|nr:tRNA pseudouridine(38-40) synthase TruA [Oscillospiraceae bacterium]
MRNLKLSIRYNGRAYHGWQVQRNAIAVQQVFQEALAQILPELPDIKGCSRTDTGVHANQYVINFKTESQIPCEKFIRALNRYLPDDIAVYECSEAALDFHARYCCKGKQYIYKIWNSPHKNPFMKGLALHYTHPLDEKLMNEVAQQFLGRHDFSAFCSANSDVEDRVRTVTLARVEREAELLTFTVEADGFLYNMVRIMAGTLLWVAEGKIAANAIASVIQSGERGRAGKTAPPEGLYLNKVFY